MITPTAHDHGNCMLCDQIENEVQVLRTDLEAAQIKLDKIQRMTETGTAQNFLKLTDQEKARWFANAVLESSARKKWEERAEAAEQRASNAEKHERRLAQRLKNADEMIPDTYDKLVELRKVELEMSSAWNQYLSDGSSATLDRYNAILKEFNRLNGSDWKAVTKEPTGEIL